MLGDSAPIDGRLLAVFALVAFVGGGVKAFIHRAEKTTWGDVVAAGVASAVAGSAIGSLLMYLWGPDKIYLIFPCVALSGWIGMVLLDFASDYAMGRVKSTLEQKDKDAR
jgi:uncharacterized membrane protein YfcA